MRLLLFSVHSVFVWMLLMITLFVNNINVLMSVGAILTITLFVNYQHGDCPISVIEDQYGSPGAIDAWSRFLLPPKYAHPSFRPLITLEMIWIGFLLVTTKILVLLGLRTFKPTVQELLRSI